jgi:hypothetical protein
MTFMHMKLLDPEFLSRGGRRQQEAFACLSRLGIFDKLAAHGPVLAGAIPIGVDIETSALEIILSAQNLELLAEEISSLFKSQTSFAITHALIQNIPTLLASFEADGFPLQLFAQNRSPLSQANVLHLLVEARLLAFAPGDAREKIRDLKRSGLDTAAAFARCFAIDGNPNQELLKLALSTDRELLTVAHRYLFRPQ